MDTAHRAARGSAARSKKGSAPERRTIGRDGWIVWSLKFGIARDFYGKGRPTPEPSIALEVVPVAWLAIEGGPALVFIIRTLPRARHTYELSCDFSLLFKEHLKLFAQLKSGGPDVAYGLARELWPGVLWAVRQLVARLTAIGALGRVPQRSQVVKLVRGHRRDFAKLTMIQERE